MAQWLGLGFNSFLRHNFLCDPGQGSVLPFPAYKIRILLLYRGVVRMNMFKKIRRLSNTMDMGAM